MASEPWYQVVEELRSLIRFGRQAGLRSIHRYEGVTSSSVGILGLLLRRGGLRLTSVAEHQGTLPSVASRQVAELVDHGLVERVPDPQDARAQLLIITDEGRALTERVLRRQVDLAARALQSWDEAEVRALACTLARLNGDLRARFDSSVESASVEVESASDTVNQT